VPWVCEFTALKDRVNQIVSALWFECGIIAFILINGVLLGMETSPSLVKHYEYLMHLGNHLILGVFILEALLKVYFGQDPYVK
jgi:voltage-gated sodium channel